MNRLRFLAAGTLWLGFFPALTADAAEPQRIVFAYENKTDLRGILNVFQIFKTACLDKPVTEGLAERLLPEGYRIVSNTFHLWGTEDGARPGVSVLSKTGSEEADFKGGFPVIHLTLPTPETPAGGCRVDWERAWDYDSGIEELSTTMAAMLPSWTSYYLEAILDTKPDSSFLPGKLSGGSTEWRTPCWDGSVCRFGMLGIIDRSRGLKFVLTRQQQRD